MKRFCGRVPSHSEYIIGWVLEQVTRVFILRLEGLQRHFPKDRWVDHVVCVDTGSTIILDCFENLSIHLTIQGILACFGAGVELMGVTEIRVLEAQPQRSEGKRVHSKTTAQNKRRHHRRL